MATFVHAFEQPVPEACRSGALTLGNFDGVHLGHQALAREARRQAMACAGPAVAVTFDPHPSQILRPDLFLPLLTTPAERAELLQAHGLDHVLILQTTPALLRCRARDFFEAIIRDGLRAKAIVEGFNFGFGKNREGTVEVLQALGKEAEIPVTLVAPVEVEGRPVSTSRVRGEIVDGAVVQVRQLLGRPYRLAGIVGAGQGRGRTLGIPTANLTQTENLIPGNGVYAVRAYHQERIYAGAANIGPNPTFGENARKVEVHLLDFHGDLYGQRLAIDFLEKIRATRPFASADELVSQVRRDIEEARRIAALAATE